MDKNVLMQLEALGKKFVNDLPSRIATIKEAYSRWRDKGEQDGLTDMHRYVHSLTGAGATFGCQQLSDDARNLEVNLKQLCANSATFNTESEALIKTPLAIIETEINKLI